MVIRPAFSGGYSIVSTLDTSIHRPLPTWKTGLAFAGAILAQLLVLAYLYNQHFAVVTPIQARSEPPPVTAVLTTLPSDQPRPQPSPVHQPVKVRTVLSTQVDTTPITVPQPPTTLQAGAQPTAGETLVQQAPQPPAKPIPPRSIHDPAWLSRPSAAEMADAYPPRAIEMNKTGEAVMACQVTTSGALASCAAVSETPANYGFGAAAVKLSKRFRMSPRTEDGQPGGGATVRIPIRFTLAD